ncbi:hypothetical protein [Streptomyces sp. CRN 30]|uniref:hypothetical protein n=1 Tax=Streptomyces sp. CRN 30 TaxID=3075613 RepID=UPI002A7F3447|nr:hypothetical protein [Streptomyces sp. CRN 30]
MKEGDIDADRAPIHAHVRAEHWVPDDLADKGADRWLVVGFHDNEAIRTWTAGASAA